MMMGISFMLFLTITDGGFGDDGFDDDYN